jgi:hypothetical protein
LVEEEEEEGVLVAHPGLPWVKIESSGVEKDDCFIVHRIRDRLSP